MNDNNLIIAQQAFDVSVNTVWKAIPDVAQMRQWYFGNIPDFKAVVGFETRLNVQNNGMDFMHIWKIIEVIPLTKIAYSWNYESYEGDAWVQFELVQKRDGTTSTLSCFGIETFPDDIPDFTRECCQAGWNYFINESLKEFLDKP